MQMEMRKVGVNVPITIDPEIFEKYKIDCVPSVVLQDGEKYHRIAGNISLDGIMRKFDEFKYNPQYSLEDPSIESKPFVDLRNDINNIPWKRS